MSRASSGLPIPPFDHAFSVPALHAAFRRALRRHRRSPEAASFLLEVGPRLCALQREVTGGRYRPDPLRTFVIREPKPREVTELSLRDRVVHHALIAAIEPALDAELDPSSFACRRGLGLHRAVRCAQELLGEHRFALSLDVRRYFASLPHAVVLTLLESHGIPAPYVALCGRILAGPPGAETAGIGMPIGALTSQHFGNLGLHPLDQLLRSRYPETDHVRYMDDIVVFGPRKRLLWQAHADVARALAALGLELRGDATRLVPATEGISFVGYRVYRGAVTLPRPARLRLARRVALMARGAASGDVPAPRARQSIEGCHAHAASAALGGGDRAHLARAHIPPCLE